MCCASWLENQEKEELISQQISRGKFSQTNNPQVKCYVTSTSFILLRILWRKRRTEKEMEENIWRRNIFFFVEEKGGKDIFCRGEKNDR